MSTELPQKHVLVVDDDQPCCQMVADILESIGGYKTKCAYGGEKALRKIEKGWKPDLIILDLMMPGMSGQDLARRLKEDDPLWPNHIMVLTAMKLSDELLAELGGLAVMVRGKPFELDQLLADCHSILFPE